MAGTAPGVYIYNPSQQNANPSTGSSNVVGAHDPHLSGVANHVVPLHLQKPLHYKLPPNRWCFPWCYKRWWINLIKQHRHTAAMRHRVRYVKNHASCPECYIHRVPESEDPAHCVRTDLFLFLSKYDHSITCALFFRR